MVELGRLCANNFEAELDLISIARRTPSQTHSCRSEALAAIETLVTRTGCPLFGWRDVHEEMVGAGSAYSRTTVRDVVARQMTGRPFGHHTSYGDLEVVRPGVFRMADGPLAMPEWTEPRPSTSARALRPAKADRPARPTVRDAILAALPAEAASAGRPWFHWRQVWEEMTAQGARYTERTVFQAITTVMCEGPPLAGGQIRTGDLVRLGKGVFAPAAVGGPPSVCLTARDAVLAAIDTFAADQGSEEFGWRDIWNVMSRQGTTYTEGTVRATIRNRMCGEGTWAGARRTNDLERAGHGRYRRRSGAEPG